MNVPKELRKNLEAYHNHLLQEEKNPATIEKYLRDVQAFLRFAQKRQITKELTVAYKQELQEKGYAPRSVNSMLAALNHFLRYLGLENCRVKSLRVQKQTYCREEQELSKAEYLRLLEASRGQEQLNLALQTLCATGIRVSELKYFTVEGVFRGEIAVRCKNKTRTILIPGILKKLLLRYARKNEIAGGMIFITKGGRALNRSNIWAKMKKLCASAGVKPDKVFPHNLRKLFARTFYSIEKDIAKLADILGHSSIETTRIYIMTTNTEHRRRIERLGLVLEPNIIRIML